MQQRGENFEEGGLARSVFTPHDECLTSIDIERDAAKDRASAKGAREIANGDRGDAHSVRSASTASRTCASTLIFRGYTSFRTSMPFAASATRPKCPAMR